MCVYSWAPVSSPLLSSPLPLCVCVCVQLDSRSRFNFIVPVGTLVLGTVHQCFLNIHRVQKDIQKNKNTTTDTNITRQINILMLRTWSLIDLNCPLLYNIEIYNMGTKC